LPEQRKLLEELIRTHSTPQQLALRARMIVHAADGVAVRESARELDVWPKTVRYWRRRWRQADDSPQRCWDHGDVSQRLARYPPTLYGSTIPRQ
jgi:transposase-like protein